MVSLDRSVFLTVPQRILRTLRAMLPRTRGYMERIQKMIVIGIDSHKDILVGCLIDAAHNAVQHREISNTTEGHDELVAWAHTTEAVVAIEGSGITDVRLPKCSPKRVWLWWRYPRR